MRGILRIALLICTLQRIQRWFLGFGLGWLVLGHIARLANPHASNPVGFATVLFGLALVVLAFMLVLGGTLRAISAPRTLYLVPYARARILLASLLVVLALAAFLTGNVALLELHTPPRLWTHMSPGTVFAGAFGAETLVTLDFFYMSGGSFSPSRFVILTACAVGLWTYFSVHLAARGISVPELALLLAAVAWPVFAVWYLTVRNISPPALGWGGRLSHGAASSRRETRISVSRETATTVQLLGLPSLARLARAGILPLILATIIVAVLAVRHPAGNLPSKTFPLYLFALFFWLTIPVAVPIATATLTMARRCRALWLQSGCTRDELFLLCERLAWRCFGAVGASIWAFCVVAWLSLPHPPVDWRYVLVAALAPCACALYVGLMNVQGWRFIDVAATVLILPAAFGSFMAASPVSYATAAPWIIVIAEVLGAVGLRALARRRWRRIDWLLCRPRDRRPAF